MAEVRNATKDEAQILFQNAKSFETYAMKAARPVFARYAWWESIRNMAGQYDVSLADVVGPEIVELNEKCDAEARAVATVLKALNEGTAELIGVSINGKLVLGVAVKGAFPKPLDGWPLIPIVLVLIGAVLTYKGLVTVDVWNQFRTAEANAQAAQAYNDKIKLEMLKKAFDAGGPDAAAQLTKVFDAADLSASQASGGIMGIAQKLGRGITAAFNTVADAVTDTTNWLLVAGLAALWFKYGRRRT